MVTLPFLENRFRNTLYFTEQHCLVAGSAPTDITNDDYRDLRGGVRHNPPPSIIYFFFLSPFESYALDLFRVRLPLPTKRQIHQRIKLQAGTRKRRVPS